MTDVDNDLDADLLGLVGDDDGADEQLSKQEEEGCARRLFASVVTLTST